MLKRFVAALQKALVEQHDGVRDRLATIRGASNEAREGMVGEIAGLKFAIQKIGELYKTDEEDLVDDEGNPQAVEQQPTKEEIQAARRRRNRGNPTRWGSDE